MTSSETQPLRIIALEEHWLNASVGQSLYRNQTNFPPPVIESLCDAGEGRIRRMDAGGIEFQVLSHTAGYTEDTLNYKAVNNDMADAVAKNPTRFAAFAHLPMADPSKAADELRRCINELGFKGALVNNHAGGRYYEGPEYNSFWATLEELDVPLYWHLTMPTSTMADRYQGSYSPQASMGMSPFAFGWHFDTATHILRLYAAGVFDRFPKLKIILGHFEESLPFSLEPVQWFSASCGPINRSFQLVYAENFWFTTSSLKGVAPLACMLQNTKLDRIIFGIDYPFLRMQDGVEWIDKVRGKVFLNIK
ncbi:2-amino-3-carboxymuconate-6-semialdehyde decarboxylase [Fusarium sp. Ph1]|nr:2-amino-3-carboxymuconate-6-semialdehyde decarboxylase [Fusarium sp. Ph1]